MASNLCEGKFGNTLSNNNDMNLNSGRAIKLITQIISINIDVNHAHEKSIEINSCTLK